MLIYFNGVASEASGSVSENEILPIKDGEIEAKPKAADHPVIWLPKGEVVVVVTRQVFCSDLATVVLGAIIQKFSQRQVQLSSLLALLPLALPPPPSFIPYLSPDDCNVLQASLHQAIKGLELIRVQQFIVYSSKENIGHMTHTKLQSSAKQLQGLTG